MFGDDGFEYFPNVRNTQRGFKTISVKTSHYCVQKYTFSIMYNVILKTLKSGFFQLLQEEPDIGL